MTDNETIQVEKQTTCLICEEPGKQFYNALTDNLFGFPGRWSFFVCDGCGLIWLNPRPRVEELDKLYATYYTHANQEDGSPGRRWREEVRLALYSSSAGYASLASGWGWRWLGKILTVVPSMRETAKLGIMWLEGEEKGRLLDVGCGNGRFLVLMRTARWEVCGVEPDPVAARLARERHGIPVVTGTIRDANFPEGHFDAITMNHVIEHVDDPVKLLAQCRSLLKPGGRLVVVTPNLGSLGHRFFGRFWVHLDPPRHLQLFTADSLKALVQRAGMRVTLFRTSARGSRWTWVGSRSVQAGKVVLGSDFPWWAKVFGMLFQAVEGLLAALGAELGDEMVVIASRSG